MKKIQNISDDAIQTHLLLFSETEITLQLKFYEISSYWVMSVSYKDKEVKGVKLSLGVLHVRSSNLPFDFVVIGEDGLGPFLINDFSSGRCSLYLVNTAEMETIRGQPVEV